MLTVSSLVLISMFVCGPMPALEGTERTKLARGKIDGEVELLVVKRIPLQDLNGRELWLRDEVAPRFLDLMAEANKDGLFIQVNSAYRTPEHQRRLWLKMPNIAGNPDKTGSHSHQTGHSVDINGTTKVFSHQYIEEWESKNGKKMDLGSCKRKKEGYECPTLLFWWLKKNAPRFGFENNVEREKWHWTYIEKEKNEATN